MGGNGNHLPLDTPLSHRLVEMASHTAPSEDGRPLGARGCARFAEILSELTKTWSSGATECGV